MTRYAVRQFYKMVSYISRGAYPKWGTGSVPCHGFTFPYPRVVYPLSRFALHSGPLCAFHGLLFLAGKGDNPVESKGKLMYLFGTLYACLTYWIF